MAALRTIAEKADGVLETGSARLGVLPGREAFEIRPLVRRFDGIRAELAGAAQTLSRKTLPDAALRQALRQAADAFALARRAGAAHNAVLAWFSADTVSLITAWAASVPALADRTLRDGRLSRTFIARLEQVVTEPRTVVRAKRSPGKLAKRLIARAQAEGWFHELPERHPKWFVHESVSRSRKIISTAITVAEVPDVTGLAPVDLSLIEQCLQGECHDDSGGSPGDGQPGPGRNLGH